VRADRSLAGRLVCGRCGTPLGGQRSGRFPWRWLLLAVVGVAAALAAVDAGFRELPRLDAPRDRPDDRWQ
jgi:predicted MFS family arabinose efflux permease